MGGQQIEVQLARLFALTPQFLVMLAGLVIAIRRLPKHPRPCWLILAAIALDGMTNLGLPILMQSVMQLFTMNNIDPTTNQMAWVFFWTLPYSVVNAVSWCLILFAVFDRPDPPKFLQEDDRDRDVLDR